LATEPTDQPSSRANVIGGSKLVRVYVPGSRGPAAGRSRAAAPAVALAGDGAAGEPAAEGDSSGVVEALADGDSVGPPQAATSTTASDTSELRAITWTAL
jgi:hypothetical protein